MNTNYTWCKSGSKLVLGKSLRFNSELLEFALSFTPSFIYHTNHTFTLIIQLNNTGMYLFKNIIKLVSNWCCAKLYDLSEKTVVPQYHSLTCIIPVKTLYFLTKIAKEYT